MQNKGALSLKAIVEQIPEATTVKIPASVYLFYRPFGVHVVDNNHGHTGLDSNSRAIASTVWRNLD